MGVRAALHTREKVTEGPGAGGLREVGLGGRGEVRVSTLTFNCSGD